jgi:hypothetical protein
MSFQTLIALSAASLSALFFVRGVVNDLRQERGNACGKCTSGGCPAARKG